MLARAAAGPPDRLARLTFGVAALVTDQIDLHEPGHSVVPLSPGPDRDLALQQRPRLSVGAALQGHRGPRRSEPPVHRRGRHHHQQASQLVADVELVEPSQHRDQFHHHRREPLARRASQDGPAEPQRRQHLQPIHRSTRPAGRPAPAPASAPPRGPSVRGCDASPSSRTTRRGSCSCRLCWPACNGLRSPSSRPSVAPSSVPSTGPTGDPTPGPAGAPTTRASVDESTNTPTRALLVSGRELLNVEERHRSLRSAGP